MSGDFAAIEAAVMADEYWQHEASAAQHDLAQESRFHHKTLAPPYQLRLTAEKQAFRFTLTASGGQAELAIAHQAMRRACGNYRRICAHYYRAARGAGLEALETMDKARRQAHLVGAAIVQQQIGGQVRTDEATARRLFTLLCALPPA